MNFKLRIPLLQQVVRVKIVSHLWNQHDIWTQIAKSNCYLPYGARREKTKEWKRLEIQVMEKVLALPLPQPYQQHLLNLIKPLGIEVVDWCRCHYEEGQFDLLLNHLPQHFSWTFRGTVDYQKTAELMARDEELDIEIRYKIACINCTEDEILKLYKRLHEDRRKEIINDVRAANSKMYPHDWMLFWTCAIDEKVDLFMQKAGFQNIFSYAEVFMCTARSGNRTACAYLFEKLSEEEKNEILVEFQWLITRNLMTVVLYVWPRMSEETQEKLFEMCAGEAILCFLCWPCQSLLLETAKRMRRYMNKPKYLNAVLSAITDKIRKGYKDYSYLELFLQFWHLLIVPSEYKEYFLNSRNFAIRLFATKEEELIKLVLYELSSFQFQRLLCSEDEFIRGMLVDEKIVSHATLNEWREKINLNLMNERDDEENKCNCQHLLRLIDSLVVQRRSLVRI